MTRLLILLALAAVLLGNVALTDFKIVKYTDKASTTLSK